jgi:hypothetical protein
MELADYAMTSILCRLYSAVNDRRTEQLPSKPRPIAVEAPAVFILKVRIMFKGMRFEVLKAVKMSVLALWAVTPCGLVRWLQFLSQWTLCTVTAVFSICTSYFQDRSRGSSGSIVWLRAGWSVRSPTEAEDFSSILCVQTGSGANPASYPMGTGGPFPGGKAQPGRDADLSPHLVKQKKSKAVPLHAMEAREGRGGIAPTHSYLVPRLRMSRSYTSSPSKRLHGV